VAATWTPVPRDDSPDPEPGSASERRHIDLPTPELLHEVADHQYGGPAWAELARRLVERALPDLEAAIVSGTIFRRCTQAGRPIRPRAELRRPPYPAEIAAEAVEDCLLRFRREALPAGEWDPGRGVSLEDFFTQCSLSDLANRWRWHLRDLLHHGEALDAIDDSSPPHLLKIVVDPAPDPADIIAMRDLVAQALAPLNPADQRSFVLLNEGWSREDVARFLGIERNTLDARLSRASRRMKGGGRHE
jgi:hypothetical protein